MSAAEQIGAAPMRLVEQARALLREHGPHLAVEVLVNILLPLLVFDWARPACGEVGALIVSSAPPLVWSGVEFLRHRRADALSVLALAGIALSLLAFLGGGGVRFLQLREKLVTALIGMVFLGSVAIGRPLIYPLARAGLVRRSPGELAEFDGWRGKPVFERTMTLMTLVWGIGLVSEAAVCSALVFLLPVRTYLVVGSALGYGTMGGLGLWNVWFSRRQRRIGRALAAAEAG